MSPPSDSGLLFRLLPHQRTVHSLLLFTVLTMLGASTVHAQEEIVLPPLNPPPPSKNVPDAPSGFPNDLPELKPPPETIETGSSLPAGLAASGLTWHSNPHNAMAKAKAGDKYLLIIFGAWSWNPTSEALCWELFATKEFKEYSKQWLNLAFIDFPQRKTDTHKNALKFKEAYGVRGYPTVVLIDPETGAFYHNSGFRKGTARAYLEELQDAVASQNAERYNRREQWFQRGFRQWSGVDGKDVFAKLLGKASDGELQFIDRSGQQFRVDPKNLSEEDLRMIPHLLSDEEPE